MAVTFILTTSNINIFAQTALEEAQNATNLPNLVFDGSKNANPYQTNFQPAPLKAPPEVKEEKKEPGLFSKMGKDLKDNKIPYLVAGGLAAFGGYLLFGTLGAAAGGLGLVVLFILMVRNLS